MPPPTITIDLGELPPASRPEHDTVGWPAWQRLRRWGARHSPREITVAALAAAVAVLTMLAVTGAAPRPGPPLARLFAIEGSMFGFDRQQVYALEWPDDKATGITISAYRLPDGAPAWQTTLSGVGAGAWLSSGGESLLLVSELAGSPGDSLDLQTTRLDRDSGAQLWTVPGTPEADLGDRVLLRRGQPDPVGTLPRHELAAVHADTGDPAWDLQLDTWQTAVGPTGAGQLYTFDRDGDLRTYRLDSGTLQATATAGSSLLRDVALLPHRSGMLALVRQVDVRQLEVNGYEPTTLQRQWTLTQDGSTSAGRPRTQPCGEALCIYPPNRPPRAYDPATGELQWSADWLSEHELVENVAVREPVHPRLAGYLLLTAVASGGPAGWLVESETGEPVLDLGSWRLRSSPPVDPDAPLLAMSRPTYQPVAGRTSVGRVLPDLSQVVPLGTIDDDYGPCRPEHSRYIVCTQDPGSMETRELTVWQIRW